MCCCGKFKKQFNSKLNFYVSCIFKTEIKDIFFGYILRNNLGSKKKEILEFQACPHFSKKTIQIRKRVFTIKIEKKEKK